METIKVMIKKASSPTYWYANRIGETVEVKRFDDERYVLLKDPWRLIFKSDCEVIPTRIEKPSLDFLLGLKHGQRVRVSRRGEIIFDAMVNAKEKWEKEYYFLCQNEFDGYDCEDKMGMKYSCIASPDNIEWIELIDTPESVGEVKPICLEQEYHIDLSSVTLSAEETITFTEDEQVIIELLDGLVKFMMKK